MRTGIDGSANLDEARDRIAALEQEVAQLREAAASRQQIGVACGLLSRRFGCTPQQAWQLLVRISQAANVKVRRIADLLVDAHCGQLRQDDIPLANLVRAHLSGDVSLVSATAAEVGDLLNGGRSPGRPVPRPAQPTKINGSHRDH